ncbi:MAG TPA: RNA polymerase factor sigma-70 [Rhodopirellula sp.]|nr:RNA polymerase factor sigma-70 [Rhodopirellula sp.]
MHVSVRQFHPMTHTSQLETDQTCDRFMSLFMGSERAIRAYVRSLLLSSQDVDDLMQDIGLKCWHKFDQFDPEGSALDFTRWCCVISRFEVLRFRRSKARDRLVLSDEVILLLATDAEQRLEQSEAERLALRDCLKKMPDPDRRLLLSDHTAGDSISQIASESNQKRRRLYSRVNMLRSQIADCVRETINLRGTSS